MHGSHKHLKEELRADWTFNGDQLAQRYMHGTVARKAELEPTRPPITAMTNQTLMRKAKAVLFRSSENRHLHPRRGYALTSTFELVHVDSLGFRDVAGAKIRLDQR
jgi:hypothetical protein